MRTIANGAEQLNQIVHAIGNPAGLYRSLLRKIGYQDDILDTAANITPGNGDGAGPAKRRLSQASNIERLPLSTIIEAIPQGPSDSCLRANGQPVDVRPEEVVLPGAVLL